MSEKKNVSSTEKSAPGAGNRPVLYLADGTPYEPRSTGGDQAESSGERRRPDQPAKEIDFLQIAPGKLIELIEDPMDSSLTKLAFWRKQEVVYRDSVKIGSRIYLPLRREGPILPHVRLPLGATPYKTEEDLISKIRYLLNQCVDLHPILNYELATFVVSTWIVDRLSFAPYVFVVGLPCSGKTTLLRTLALVCRRSLFTADISSAALYNACSLLKPTLLIDEAELSSDFNSRQLRRLLRSGSTQDAVTMRRDASYASYGAKVISCRAFLEDSALLSRCIIVGMSETKRANLVDASDPRAVQFAQDLTKQLLYFRLERHNVVRPDPIPDDEQLRPRSRDLLRSLAAPYSRNSEICKILVTLFKHRDDTTPFELSPGKRAVAKALFAYSHYNPDTDYFKVGTIANLTNTFLQRWGERLRLSERMVGSVLSELGFEYTQRTNAGYIRWLDNQARERIHAIVRTYGVDVATDPWLLAAIQNCSMCQPSSSDEGKAKGEREHGEHREHVKGRARARGRRRKSKTRQ